MIIAITGTPGTGKTTIAQLLETKGFIVYNLKDVAIQNKFIDGYDEDRDSIIVNIEKLDRYIRKLDQKLVFIEGHLSHLLTSVRYIVILRCHPRELRKRLDNKGWNKKKVLENIQAEILDIILGESIEIHPRDYLFEIDTTNLKPNEIADMIIHLVKNNFIPEEHLTIGRIDWSEELLKDESLWKE